MPVQSIDLNIFEPIPVTDWLLPWLTSADRENVADFGDKYSWYASYGYYLEPQAVLEIGIKHGYSIASICYGAFHRSSPPMFVTLVDSQQAGGDLQDVRARLLRAFPRIRITGRVEESQKVELPPLTMFDLVHVDACHDEEAAYHDIVKFSRHLVRGGLLVVDDTDDANVMHSCERFMIEEEEAGRPWDFRIIPCTCGHVLMTKL